MSEKNFSLEGKSILVTGATGSFGHKFIKRVLEEENPRRLVIFSRDELKQYQMAQVFPESKYPQLRYFIGDVRDKERLERACSGIDVIVHAAAMKHIDISERNPDECISTNIIGAENIIHAAIANSVERVIALSTDKAANPINLYGATKLCSDKLFIAANNLSGTHRTQFSVVRYGNVIGSRGSVIPFFKKVIAEGVESLPITHEEMTRFVITLDQGVDFVIQSLSTMLGGELFVPKLPSIKIIDLVRIINPTGKYHTTGIRPGEKLHEVMIPLDESRNALDMGEYYIIQPTFHWWNVKALQTKLHEEGKAISDPFEYDSNNNTWWLTNEELKELSDSVSI